MRGLRIAALVLVAALGVLSSARAQGTCGAAGGPPNGSVCDLADIAAGLPSPRPATGAGNPVDVVTGNKYRAETDLRLDGVVPLAFVRHYNSRNRHAGVLGIGWSHSFETRVASVPGRPDELQIVQGDGRRIVFRRFSRNRDSTFWRATDPADGRIETPAPDYRYRVDPRDTLRWHLSDGRTLVFDAEGRLDAIEVDGRPSSGALREVPKHADDRPPVAGWVSGGRELRFEYVEHAQGPRLARVRLDGHGPGGRDEVARFEYDALGQLAAVVRADGTTRRYRYDDPHDPLLLTEVVDAVGGAERSVARHEYDVSGRPVRTRGEDGTLLAFDWEFPVAPRGVGTTVVTDDTGRVARYRWRYDRHRHEPQLLASSGDACAACPPAPRRYDWDDRGRLRGLWSPTGAIAFEHSADGLPIAAWRRAGRDGSRTLLWRVGWQRTDGGPRLASIEQPSIAPGRLHAVGLERRRDGHVVAVVERGWSPSPASPGRFEPLSRRFSLETPDAATTPARRVPGPTPRLLAIDGPRPGRGDRIALGPGDRPDELLLAWPGGRVDAIAFRLGTPASVASTGGPPTSFERPMRPARAEGSVPVVSAARGAVRVELVPTDAASAGVLRRDPATDPDGTVFLPPGAPALRALSAWRGRATAIELPDGAVFRRGFDDFGRVVWIDEPGQPRQWARWDEGDRLIEHRPGDGSVLRYRRDDAGRLLEATVVHDGRESSIGRYRWQGAELVEASNDTVSIAWTRDARGRLAGAEHRFAWRPEAPLRWHWAYDDRDRIVAESLPGGWTVRHRYEGDARVGLSIDGPAASVRIDPAALRTALSPGERAAAPVGAPDARFVAGRLVEANGTSHLPDPHGRRAAKRDASGGRTIGFAHDDWRLRAELDGERLRQWVWDGARPVALIDGGRVLRVVTDERLAPVRVLDADGRAVWSATYDRDGGAIVGPDAALDVGLRLPGQYLDPETGWHHNHWRTYDPGRGAYLERDPLGLQPEFDGRASLHAYAGGDPLGYGDPWGLARLSWYAIGRDERGAALGRTQGWDNARWSFLIEDILPTTPEGGARARPLATPFDGLLYDPWGDFVGRSELARGAGGNRLDAVAWSGTGGREVVASFAAHYAGALVAPERFVVDAFDDRRASAIATILAAAPGERASCVERVLGSLRLPLAESERPLPPAADDTATLGPARVLACREPTTLPVRYRDDLERSRVERLQAAAEMQESPGSAIRVDCVPLTGCRSEGAIVIGGRRYHASYGRTQFTVTTFLPELVRLSSPAGGADAIALRAAVGLDAPIELDGRPATMADALALARARVDASYRAFPTLRAELGAPLDAARAAERWDALPEARREVLHRSTGLGRDAFVDMLVYRQTDPRRDLPVEEARHAIAASAAATVGCRVAGRREPQRFDQWLVALFSSRDPYDHVSRAFLRDNLRRVVDAPALAPELANAHAPGSDAWRVRQTAVETNIARRVALLHNSGRADLALRPGIDRALEDAPGWSRAYVASFVSNNSRGDWETIRCTDGLAGRAGLRMAPLLAMSGPAALGPRERGPTRIALGLPAAPR